MVDMGIDGNPHLMRGNLLLGFGHSAIMCPFASATGGNAPSLGISYLLFGNVIIIRNYYHAYFLKGLESATTSSTDGFQWQENE